ncbi:hypothetical protein FLGE108171_05585 [Flavobacterium gelidilacus]|uniref:hypothetical protein n=1 Tax=Flavobacterium gelidilacus TaxID=206041 RepID=UPI00042828A8|nr:hypothetical protein [Flavobacterium gelidilacus]
MEKFETKFTKNDIKKIKRKRSLSNLAYIIAFFMLGSSIYFFNDSFDIVMKIIFYVFFGITLFATVSILFGDNSKKDLNEKIKIVTKVIVTQKRIKSDSDTGSHYIVEFQESDDIKEYYVNYKMYDKIKIGDSIELEYSKTSLWILKAVWNNIDLENNKYVK